MVRNGGIFPKKETQYPACETCIFRHLEKRGNYISIDTFTHNSYTSQLGKVALSIVVSIASAISQFSVTFLKSPQLKEYFEIFRTLNRRWARNTDQYCHDLSQASAKVWRMVATHSLL